MARKLVDAEAGVDGDEGDQPATQPSATGAGSIAAKYFESGEIIAANQASAPAKMSIIGPRTMEHLDAYLAADGVDLSGELLDRIDQIVPPGVTVNVADNMCNVGRLSLGTALRRRDRGVPTP